ncbi:MAG: prolipoprotein diacylglyceryl transferase [Sumerlaeia bacterium]
MHPILFHITDNFFIGTYGVMIALGLLAAVAMAAWRGARRGLSPEMFTDLAFVTVLGGFLFARLTYIIVEWETFVQAPGEIIFSRYGFVFLGGLLGGVGAGIAYVKWKKLPMLAIGDVAAPSIALGHAFGRIGCHLAGCCYGGLCESPFGIRLHPEVAANGTAFPNAWSAQVDAGIIPPDAAQSLPIWPVQLFESAGLFLLAGLLVWIASRRPHKPGIILGLYLLGYSVLRFGLEFLRGDAERGFLIEGVLSTSQFLSVLMIPVGAFLLLRARKLPVSPHSHPSIAPPLPERDADEDGEAPRSAPSKPAPSSRPRRKAGPRSR